VVLGGPSSKRVSQTVRNVKIGDARLRRDESQHRGAPESAAWCCCQLLCEDIDRCVPLLSVPVYGEHQACLPMSKHIAIAIDLMNALTFRARERKRERERKHPLLVAPPVSAPLLCIHHLQHNSQPAFSPLKSSPPRLSLVSFWSTEQVGRRYHYALGQTPCPRQHHYHYNRSEGSSTMHWIVALCVEIVLCIRRMDSLRGPVKALFPAWLAINKTRRLPRPGEASCVRGGEVWET
jgi:hypothetical protein